LTPGAIAHSAYREHFRQTVSKGPVCSPKHPLR
jgi:hypothetical protein